MIQNKDFMVRILKEVSGILNKLSGSYPDNNLGISEADIEQQIYTATGRTTEHFLQLDDQALEETVNQKGVEHRPLFLDFLGNLYYHEYQVTNNKDYLQKAKTLYNRYQEETATFSMVYFQRMQKN